MGPKSPIQTYGPPVVSPLSVASFLLRRAISLSFLAAVVAARLVSMILFDNVYEWTECLVEVLNCMKCPNGSCESYKLQAHKLSEICLCKYSIFITHTSAMTLKETISQATDAVEGIERPTISATVKTRKRFVGTSTPKASSSKTVRRVANQIPDDILHDAELNAAINGKSCIRSIIRNADITALPGNYNFEIHKTIYQVRRDGVKTVALQMPEGLMMYGCAIADIVERSVLTPFFLDSRLILVDLQEHCRYYLPM
jgi:hypothetical protein